MAKLTKLSNTKWKQPFIDRAREYHLWTIHKDVTAYCGIEDGQNRKIRISFAPELQTPDIERVFHVTSGNEISFPKDIQRVIGEIVQQNRSSYFIAEILDVDTSTPSPDDIAPPNLPERALCQTYRILRDTALARRLKEWHQNKCQICQTQIPLPDGSFYSEAHHIKPLGNGHNGPDVPENIIVVCPNHHAMLDYGSVPLSLNSISLHSEHDIASEYVDYHNEVICGAESANNRQDRP